MWNQFTDEFRGDPVYWPQCVPGVELVFHVRKVVLDGLLCVGTTSAVSPAQESSYEADSQHHNRPQRQWPESPQSVGTRTPRTCTSPDRLGAGDSSVCTSVFQYVCINVSPVKRSSRWVSWTHVSQVRWRLPGTRVSSITAPLHPHLCAWVEDLLLHDGLPAHLTHPEQLHQVLVVNNRTVLVHVFIRLIGDYGGELRFRVEAVVQRVDRHHDAEAFIGRCCCWRRLWGASCCSACRLWTKQADSQARVRNLFMCSDLQVPLTTGGRVQVKSEQMSPNH